jgi:hypothetical protein
LSGSSVGGDVDAEATSAWTDHGLQQNADHRQPDEHTFLRAGAGVPGQQEVGHELEQALSEQMPFGECEPISHDAGPEAEAWPCQLP